MSPSPSTINSSADLYMERGSRKEMELLLCGSRSSSRTLCPLCANAAARLIVVVVLPTPPFGLAMAMILLNGLASGLSLQRVAELHMGKSPASPITSGHSSSPAEPDSSSLPETVLREARITSSLTYIGQT